MKNVILDFPTLGFVVGTRAALAFGLGLLMSTRFREPQRRMVGLTLVAIGAIATIPAAMSVGRGFKRADRMRLRPAPPTIDRDEALVGAQRFPRKGDDD